MKLERGEIYYAKFPYTHDTEFPNGKNKFLVVLQEGYEFNRRDTIVVLLTTSDKEEKGNELSVTIEAGTTKLHKETYILCSQPYTLPKDIFNKRGAWCAGKLKPEVLDEIDEALYLGLCMGNQNEVE